MTQGDGDSSETVLDDAGDGGEEQGSLTPFRVLLEAHALPGAAVPALTLMLHERRSGGWTGTAHVNPRHVRAEWAFRTLLQDGLLPGRAVAVKLVVAGDSRYAGTVVRLWPSVVTSVNATPGSPGPSDVGEAFCAITFSDPLSHLRSRALWCTFANRSLGEILGGALSAATGGDGRPTRSPALPGMPAVRILEQLRDEIGEIPYAIAVGEPLGYWLSQICGRLGVRIGIRGDTTGQVLVELCDGNPLESIVNGDGGVTMTVNPDAVPSATNLTIAESAIGPPSPDRGTLLDVPARGAHARFGRPGAVETVIVAARTDAAEAQERSAFRRTAESLSRVRVSMYSGLPTLLPARVVKLDAGQTGDEPQGEDPELDASGEGGQQTNGYTSLFGAKEWQVADIAHLCFRGQYRNLSTFEKTGAAWRPGVPPEEGVEIISGVVDDGESATGKAIARDPLGRVPIRIPSASEASNPESSASAAGTSWPPIILLAHVEPTAGGLHGFVRAHRQGDWCRVAVVNPLYAEVVGFGYRDDRYLSDPVHDATMGMLVHQDSEEWRGILFRPEDDLPREFEEQESPEDDPPPEPEEQESPEDDPPPDSGEPEGNPPPDSGESTGDSPEGSGEGAA